MSNAPFDVVGIGNAIVDVLCFADDAFLARHLLINGTMTLVDKARSAALYRGIGQGRECSGGSVANTLAGMASLGARTAFIGKVGDDQLGEIFTHDMRTVGVHFATLPLVGDLSTANCLVFVTSTGERTMATYLGACSQVTEEDIDEELIKHASVVYIEGYLWDEAHAKAAILRAVKLAKQHNRKIAFTLSDTFCVDRHRGEFMALIKNDIDIVFANENELKSLYETNDVAEGLSQLQSVCKIAVVTRSEKGSVVMTPSMMETVPTAPVAKVVDTTGAGDLYAAGFLFGFTRGWDLKACALLGNKCAGEIIQQLGARSTKPLKELVA